MTVVLRSRAKIVRHLIEGNVMINDKTDLVTMLVVITLLASAYWFIAIAAHALFLDSIPPFVLLWWLANLASMATFFSVELSDNRAAKARRVL
jgi:hypothetical protein